MIITDKVLYSLGFHEMVVRSLEDNGIRYGIFNEIASEPDDNIIDAALKAVRESGAQCIIAIGAMYHIPHGNAIALCLIPVLEWLKPYCVAKYAEMSRMCGFSAENENDAVAADRFLAEVAALMKKCGLSLDGGMIRDEDYDRLTELIAKDSFFYSTPKAMKVSDIRDILNNIRK